MANSITLTFAGDADSLARAAKKAEAALAGVGDSATSSSRDMEKAGKSSGDMLDRMSKLGNVVDGASTAVEGITGTLSGLADVQDAARSKNARLERALNDVAQAQEDYNQAVLDGKQATVDATQAGIDARQAQLDAETAQLDYNTAVKEHGANSTEAKQASIDLAQAQADLTQANLDGEQALRDGNQAMIDAKGAQLDLNEAQNEAHPPALRQWADDLQAYAPLLQGLVGIVGLVTAAQWLWNAAQLASPMTWVIIGITALIAVIVLIATKTDWFQRAWSAAWGWIKNAASSAWDFIKRIPGWIGDAFSYVGNAISAPFKSAFNYISRAWNATVGNLSWSVPGWVPFIGGNTISVPKLPTFHRGGEVPGAPGTEMLARLEAGERVIPAGQSGRGSGDGPSVTFAGNLSDALAVLIMQMIRTGQIQVG